MSRAVLVAKQPSEGGPAVAAEAITVPGYVEAFAFAEEKGVWIVLGWTRQVWDRQASAEHVLVQLQAGLVTGPASTAFYDRPDVPVGAKGFVTILAAPRPPAGKAVAFEVPTRGIALLVGDHLLHDAIALATEARRLVATCCDVDASFPDLLPRPPYTGLDTVAELWPPIHLELDQVLVIPSSGVLLIGWLLDLANDVLRVRLCSSRGAAELNQDAWLPLRRPDVLEAFKRRYPMEDENFGFVAFGAIGAEVGELRLEITTRSGRVAYKPLRAIPIFGLGVIKALLGIELPDRSALMPIFNQVLGPAVEQLNRTRLSVAKPPRLAEYGRTEPAPRISLVVPIFGRLDFFEYQLALFSAHPVAAVEIIYVLDDPRLAAELSTLATSCWARFRVPFKIVFLQDNLGFAPATNRGAAAATGRYLCLLNSDVFPQGGDGLGWAEALADTLENNPCLGAVGPMLLYRDDTIQHIGMHYQTVDGLPPWAFPIHHQKGTAQPKVAALHPSPAITGACLMVGRDRFHAMGGLDEGFLIGDFEDSDFCLKLGELGLQCAVNSAVRLYHLERQSQGASEAWRFNVTLYNAWRHHRRWHANPAATPTAMTSASYLVEGFNSAQDADQ